MPKILHLNTFDYGGAAVAAKHICSSLSDSDFSSRLLVRTDVFKSKWHISRLKRSLVKSAIDFLPMGVLVSRMSRHEKITFIQNSNKLSLAMLPPHDLLHLHWVSDFFDWEYFFATIPPHHPIVWTLHDCNLLTGGCHYPAGCVKFRGDCSDCPATKRQAAIRRNFAIKKELLKGRRLQIVYTSSWMKKHIQESPILSELQAKYIPLWPRFLKSTAEWKIFSQDKDLHIGFMASGIHRPNKGLSVLLEALNGVKDVCLHIAGDGRLPPNITNYNYKYYGHIDEKGIPAFFNKIDYLVVPSFNESFGQVAMEAIQLGCPVIAARTGAHFDLVGASGKNGYIFEPGDVNALIHCLGVAQKSKLGRSIASPELPSQFDQEFCATQYKNLYMELSGEA